MKLPFTWEELTPEDKALLEKVPATAVWDFIATLPADERAPFDAPLYSPSGADFMREYGDRLRQYLASHPFEESFDPEWIARLNELSTKYGVDPEATRTHLEKLDQLQRDLYETRDLEAYEQAVAQEEADFHKAHGAEISRFSQEFNKALEDFTTPKEGFDPLVITAKRQLEEKRKHATSSQGGTDRALTEVLARIKDLEAKIKETEAERDAARRAYLDLRYPIPQPSNKRRK